MASVDGIFCNGIEREVGNGTCVPSPYSACDDRNEDTVDMCYEATQRCVYKRKRGTPICQDPCEPDCQGKECGNDGCGAFCGYCPSGKGCRTSNVSDDGSFTATCVISTLDGTCRAPFPFGPNGTTTLNLPREGQLSWSFQADTGEGVHGASPVCNAMSSAPELYFTFTVPADRSYGLTIRTSGYDTVLQLSKGCSRADFITCK
eukprot:jgi/Mesvir1/26516/Mv16173-RA.1